MINRKLNEEEIYKIESIIDDEEKNIDNFNQSNSSLSRLDDQCRQIWPNWDNFSPTHSRNSKQKVKYSNTKYENTEKTQNYQKHFYSNPLSGPTEVYQDKKLKIGEDKLSYMPNSGQIPDYYNFDRLKTDINDIYTKIHYISTGSAPHKQENDLKHSTNRNKKGDSENSNSWAPTRKYLNRDSSEQMKYNKNVDTPSRKFWGKYDSKKVYGKQDDYSTDYNARYNYGISPDKDYIPSKLFNGASEKFPKSKTSDVISQNFQFSEIGSQKYLSDERISRNYNTASFGQSKRTPSVKREDLEHLKKENFKLRTELMNIKKKYQIEVIENQRLNRALEKSEALICQSSK